MDVHPTKNVSIGIDPYPYIYMLSGPPSTRNFHVFSIALPGLIVQLMHLPEFVSNNLLT
jgi:hypothetical protein